MTVFLPRAADRLGGGAILSANEWKNTSILRKAINSLNGFRVALLKERAVMQETVALVIAVMAAIYFGCDVSRIFLVFLACLLPITLELVNSAVEIFMDHVLGSTYREEIRRAKDMLSAAVCVALIIGYSGSLWIIIFADR